MGAKGVLNANSIAEVSNIESLVFGSNDLTKDLKSIAVSGRSPLLYSMSHCILAARAAGKQVIDGVFMDIKDVNGFQEECITGKNLTPPVPRTDPVYIYIYVSGFWQISN